ncbi:MAG TPA: hypothetical protein VGQ99_17040 [Tepidisphaeraceae bacterium]|nr:hypothetical protein [Tepidisphaeraceae bacterium]
MAFRNEWAWVVGLMLVVAAMGQGCSSRPEMAERNVVVTLDDTLARAAAVEVNLIGANDTDFPRVASRSVDEYWRDVAGDRAPSDRYIMKLSGADRTKTLSRTDPIWQKWRAKGAMRLVAIAFIPGVSGSGEGERDPRRIILPLDKNRWKELVDIRIIASQSGLSCPTQPEPEKK